MKKNTIKNINEIRSLVSRMPRTINEAVFEDGIGGYVNEVDDFAEEPKQVEPETGMGAEEQKPVAPALETQPEQPVPTPEGPVAEPGAEEPVVDPAPADMPEEKGEGDALNVEEFVDDIRKKALRGMAQLAETPEDERYQLLKKIWQICDKKPEQQTAFSNPNNPQPAQPVKKI